ncbi:YbfB/YjiJ family MFS transporter [Paraburkholderia fungorum]|jgi:predicted MFS family arabinose efflux permease|uniref:YbfB/YjiJ family MFS transporter n=1 Tax=Paraburkholderia fungorum TaxID=134537 RepID=UPI0004AA2E67|nr:YbfB/YjiJ family MFS transporter [Paraburkholderia fungorum]KFX66051.1 MFS transporter [Burkholderia sp. K24]USX05842.1 YbfB/YjiJ family MFS transporter [Paraburkholderia fungorum]
MSIKTRDIASTSPPIEAAQRLPTLMLAIGLSLGSAIALGLARFAYALLLPSMKLDLGWSFAEAGAMNTANALGYLLGALAFPQLARRWPPGVLFGAGCAVTALLMAISGLLADTHSLLALRVITGVSSAAIFISGGVLAARLASARPHEAGLVLGLYYGGTGWGIVASSVLVPLTIVDAVHGWQFAWFALAAACAAFAAIAVGAARKIDKVHAPGSSAAHAADTAEAPRWPRFSLALAGYGLFGVGYIGYMTFIVALLRNAGMSAAVVTGFYLLLGVATVVSARLWSGLLDRMRGGHALAILNALLAVATLLPALFTQPWVAFVSGVLFGATFLSAVASTTAFVRHNLPVSHWAKGISAFTIVFAFGQIVGPMVIGWVSDGAGLARGLVYSALLLAAGAALAACQKPLRKST